MASVTAMSNAHLQEPHLMNIPDTEDSVGYTSDGWLNEMALHCGYVERIDVNNTWLTLWREGCYHVRMYDFDAHKRIFWDTFDNINDARARFTEVALMMIGEK